MEQEFLLIFKIILHIITGLLDNGMYYTIIESYIFFIQDSYKIAQSFLALKK